MRHESFLQEVLRDEKITKESVTPYHLSRIARKSADNKDRWKALYLTAKLAQTHKGDSLVPDTIYYVIRSPEDITGLLTAYCGVCGADAKSIKSVMSHGLRRGIARAFTKFTGMELLQQNRPGPIKLRDAISLCHVKAGDRLKREDIESILLSRPIDFFSGKENDDILSSLTGRQHHEKDGTDD